MIRNFLHMLGYCRPYRRLYLYGILALLVVDILDVATPMLVRWGIDHVRYGAPPGRSVLALFPAGWFGPDGFMGGMWVYFALYIAAVGVTGFFRFFMSMRFSEAAIALTHDLRGRFFAHVQRLSAGYHDRSRVGEQMSLATNDTDACRFFYGFGLLIMLDTLFYFLFVPAVMASISLKLLLACLIPLPLIPFVVSRLTHRVENRFEELQKQFAVLSERARESYSGAKVVQSFAREEGEIRSYAKLCREYLRRGLRLAVVTALENPLLTLMLGLADLVVVILGGHLVLRGLPLERSLISAGAGPEQIIGTLHAAGAMTTGEFVVFFQYLIRLSGPMIGFGWMVTLYQRGRVSLSRVEAVLAEKPAILDPQAPESTKRPAPAGMRGAIEIRDLVFAYDGQARPALDRISLSIPARGTLGIIGPIGSGKSTLLNLLPRLYDPPPGTIRIDGIDIREIPLARLRSQIGVVPQETFLFSETIDANIGLGMAASGKGDGRAADRDAIASCARLAQIESEILALPRRYESMLGERGVNLSGGQKQRLAIARALARDPAILLLDDCLSAVDSATEESILEGIRRESRKRTTILVSHRVDAVAHADEIIVLQEGRIAERGSHEALLALGGYYADLHAKQQIEAHLSAS